MMLVSTRRRFFAGTVAAGFMLAVAGCQSSDGRMDLGLGGSAEPAQPERPRVTEAELRAFCPPVTLREGTSFFRSYAKGGDGDPEKLAFQASISDVTRSCTYPEGMIAINVAAAGRIVSGPVGTAGTVTLPIRVAVVRGTEVLYSQVHKYQVNLATSGASQFIFSDPNVLIPLPEPRTVQVFVGYDEGPPKKN